MAKIHKLITLLEELNVLCVECVAVDNWEQHEARIIAICDEAKALDK